MSTRYKWNPITDDDKYWPQCKCGAYLDSIPIIIINLIAYRPCTKCGITDIRPYYYEANILGTERLHTKVQRLV